MKTAILLITTLSFSVSATTAEKSPRVIQVETRKLINNKKNSDAVSRAISFDAAPKFQTSISISPDGKKSHQCDQIDAHHLHLTGEQQ